MSAQDSGGYNDSNIEVKFQQAIANLVKTLGGEEKLTKNQMVQTRKIIVQHEKKYNSDKDHWRWKDQDRQKQRKFAIEKIEMQGQQVRMNKQLSNAMKHNLDSYNYVKQSLTGGGRSLKSGILGVSDSLALLTKSSRDLIKAEKVLKDAKKSGGDVKGAQTVVDELKNTISKLGGNNRVMKSIVSKLEGLSKIMEKHQGKVMIGAGVASILIGIISKALNVAPLFQAMMKLMQFAVTMILMPIGTFFGAILRPLVIGFVRGTAKNFGAWMKTAMSLGTKIGEFIMEFLKNPAAAFGNLFKNSLGGDPASIAGTATTLAGAGTAVAVATKILPKVLTTAAKGSSGAITFASGVDDAAKLGKSGWSLSNLLKGSLGIGKIGAVGAGMGGGLSSILTGGKTSEKAAEIATKGLAKVIPKVLTTSIPLGIKLGFKAIPVLGWATLAADVAGSAMKQWAPDQYEGIRQGALGVGSFLGDTEGTHTEGFLDILGFGKQSTFEMLGEGFQELSKVFNGGSTETIAESAERSAGFVETLEKAAIKMGTQSAPTMDSQMTEIMNSFIRMKEMGMTSKLAAERTADLFSLAEATVEAKIQQWIDLIPPKKDGGERAEKKFARSALNQWQSGTADNFFGGSNYVNPWTKNNQGTESVQTKMEKEAERIITAFNKANPHTSYADIYGTKETTPSEHKYPTGFDQSGMTRAQMDQKNNGLPTTSTGAVDWNSYLNPNYAGGQISEPILGIGRSGRTYSFGEHGAETITPNGQMGGGGGITINIARIEKNADFEQLKPMIQKWILEANSRRGMI